MKLMEELLIIPILKSWRVFHSDRAMTLDLLYEHTQIKIKDLYFIEWLGYLIYVVIHLLFGAVRISHYMRVVYNYIQQTTQNGSM